MEAVPLLATLVGLVVLTWRYRRRTLRLPVGVHDNFDVDAAVAIHVAHREATERSLPVTPVHLLYGLLQVEAFTAAIAKLGGDAAAIEQRVTAALADKPADASLGLQLEANASIAAQHEDRAATITDLWYRLARTPAAALVDQSVTPHGLLFLLVHGLTEPPATHADPEVHVVIRNDDYTPMRFVAWVVHALFERPPEDSLAVTKAAHDQGRAIIGRFATARAIELVSAARAKARESGYPLWLELEPW